MLFFSPLNRLAKVNSALTIGVFLLVATSIGIVGPQSVDFIGLNIRLTLNDIFFKWWYLGLEILLAVSLLSCSLLDQLFVLKCQINTVNKLKRVRVYVHSPGFQESTQLSQLNQRLSKISANKANLLTKGMLRQWAPLGVHLLATAILAYGALDMLYASRENINVSSSNGFFLSSSGSEQASLSHSRPYTYCRINDMWSLTDPYQPFIDMSLLDMKGREYGRLTLTNPSQSYPGHASVEGRLSLGGLTPLRVRLLDQETYWELPALATSKGASSSGWIAAGLDEELLTGWEEGQMVLYSTPSMSIKWDQQDFAEEFTATRTSAKIVDLLSEAKLTWSTNDFSINIFLVPLVAILSSLVLPSLDVTLDYERAPTVGHRMVYTPHSKK